MSTWYPIPSKPTDYKERYEAAVRDAKEAEAYAEALEAKLYDIGQEEMKAKDRGPWPGAIRAVHYRLADTDNGGPAWGHRLEQYRKGAWTTVPVYQENEDGTLKEIPQ
jgi:hypothetical protein